MQEEAGLENGWMDRIPCVVTVWSCCHWLRWITVQDLVWQFYKELLVVVELVAALCDIIKSWFLLLKTWASKKNKSLFLYNKFRDTKIEYYVLWRSILSEPLQQLFFPLLRVWSHTLILVCALEKQNAKLLWIQHCHVRNLFTISFNSCMQPELNWMFNIWHYSLSFTAC